MSTPTIPTCNVSNCESCSSTTPESCIKCKEGFTIEKNLCIPCPQQNCQTCDGINCLSCQKGYSFINDYCQRGKCTEPHCLISGYKGCSNCQKGYSIFNGQCHDAPCSNFYPNCLECDINGCINCDWIWGYALTDGVCTKKVSDWITWPIVFLIPFGILLLIKKLRKSYFGRRGADFMRPMLIEDGSFILYHENFYHESESQNTQQQQGVNLDETDDEEYVSNFKNERKIEANLYNYSFQTIVFLKVFLFNLLCAFGLGVVVVPFLNYICGWNFGRNISSFQTQRITMLLGLVSTVYIIHGIVTKTLSQINTQTLEHFESLFFFCIASASIAAYANQQVTDLFSFYRLKKKIDSNNRCYWKFFRNEVNNVLEEVNSTFLRLNIDASLFYMKFLECENPEPHYLRSYISHEALEVSEFENFKQDMVLHESLPYMFSRTAIDASELLNKIPTFERCLIQLRYLSGTNRYDKSHAFGYQVAQYIARHIRGGRGSLKIIIGLTLINYLLCFAYDIYSHDNSQPATWMKWASTIIWLVLNFLPRGLIAYLIFETVVILASKLEHMRVLQQMLLTNRLPMLFEQDKRFPVIDIFDVMSLKTWNTLRKVFMHLNEQRLSSLSLAIAILLAIQVSILAVITLFHFKVFHLDNINITNYLTFFALDTTLFLIIICLVFYYCYKVNGESSVHRNLVRINKGIVVTLFRSYPSLVKTEGLYPGSYIYNCGLKALQKEFGKNFAADKLENRLQSLIETYDQILQDLEYEDLNYPLKFYGVPVRKAFLTSLAIMIVTSLTPIIKKFLASSK